MNLSLAITDFLRYVILICVSVLYKNNALVRKKRTCPDNLNVLQHIRDILSVTIRNLIDIFISV